MYEDTALALIGRVLPNNQRIYVSPCHNIVRFVGSSPDGFHQLVTERIEIRAFGTLVPSLRSTTDTHFSAHIGSTNNDAVMPRQGNEFPRQNSTLLDYVDVRIQRSQSEFRSAVCRIAAEDTPYPAAANE